MLQALFITITLGVYFTLLQASEYYEAPFTISDGVYGSTFFVDPPVGDRRRLPLNLLFLGLVQYTQGNSTNDAQNDAKAEAPILWPPHAKS